MNNSHEIPMYVQYMTKYEETFHLSLQRPLLIVEKSPCVPPFPSSGRLVFYGMS